MPLTHEIGCPAALGIGVRAQRTKRIAVRVEGLRFIPRRGRLLGQAVPEVIANKVCANVPCPYVKL